MFYFFHCSYCFGIWCFIPYDIKLKKGDLIYDFFKRLNEEERNLATAYARIHSLSLGEAFKQALFDRIEDEYDLAVADEAYREYVASGCKSTPIADFWREMDEEEV